MNEHQQRVITEKQELDEKRAALRRFIEENPIFATIPDAEQRRLKQQRRIMGWYSEILSERIEAF